MNSGLQVSHIAYPVTALGPGHRIAIWVAGCPLKCKGCITPSLQDPNHGKQVSIDKLTDKLLSIKEHSEPTISGITMTGGEPFAQPLALAQLWRQLSDASPEWDLLVFSGYRYAQLQAMADAWPLLQHIDILIDGPYLPNRAAPTGKQPPLLASSNQSVHYLSRRGQQLQSECQSLPSQSANIAIGSGETAWLIGILSQSERTRIHQSLRRNDSTWKGWQ